MFETETTTADPNLKAEDFEHTHGPGIGPGKEMSASGNSSDSNHGHWMKAYAKFDDKNPQLGLRLAKADGTAPVWFGHLIGTSDNVIQGGDTTLPTHTHVIVGDTAPKKVPHIRTIQHTLQSRRHTRRRRRSMMKRLVAVIHLNTPSRVPSPTLTICKSTSAQQAHCLQILQKSRQTQRIAPPAS